MIDTLNTTLYTNWHHISNIQSLLQSMQSSHDNFTTGTRSYRGGIRNLSIQINEHRIKIEGSLSKFYFGNNVQSLDVNTLKLAIEELSDITSLPIMDAQINRLDIAQNLSVRYQPEAYYKYFGERARMQRLEQGNGLYYRNTLSECSFYNKTKEIKKSKLFIDSSILLQNLLRFEVRRYGHRNICKHFHVPDMKVERLCNPVFYQGLVNDWSTEYNKIDKNNEMPMFEDRVYQEPKQFCNQITYKGIEAMGGYNTVMSLIKQARHREVFKTMDQYYSLQRKMRNLKTISDKSVPNTLIDEINSKVRDIVLFCD